MDWFLCSRVGFVIRNDKPKSKEGKGNLDSGLTLKSQNRERNKPGFVFHVGTTIEGTSRMTIVSSSKELKWTLLG